MNEELVDLFKQINELTAKYPELTSAEVRELRTLSHHLNNACTDIIFHMEIEKHKGVK
jgi:hypothetical protein